MSIFSKIYEIGKTIHDTVKEINILDKIYKQDERIYKGSLLNQIDEMENSADEAENIIRKEINLEQSSQKLKQKQGLFRTKKYAALFAKHHKSETDILLKPAANIGAAEIEKARRFSMFENNNPQLGKEIDAKIEDWYNTIYGTAPLRRDGTGRQIEPAIKIRLQSNGKLSTKDGLDMEQSLWKLAERMSEIDDDDTSETGVAALQKSLNNLGAKPPLKTDGQLGPKTTLQTRRQLADNGYLPLINTLKRI